ncbi:EthD family reductase [Comamonas humi]
MIKVNVMYPYTEGARFDHAYYRDRHMPMVKARLGSACAYYTVEKGLVGGAPGTSPGTPPAFVAMCAFICDSVAGYQAAMQEHRAEILADIANYTDIVPVLQVSEVVVERSDR